MDLSWLCHGEYPKNCQGLSLEGLEVPQPGLSVIVLWVGNGSLITNTFFCFMLMLPSLNRSIMTYFLGQAATVHLTFVNMSQEGVCGAKQFGGLTQELRHRLVLSKNDKNVEQVSVIYHKDNLYMVSFYIHFSYQNWAFN